MSNKISDLVYKTVMGQLSDINEKNNRLLIELLEVKIKIPLLLEENNTHMEPCAEEEYNINIMSETTQLDEYKYISSLITKLENKIKFFNKEQKTLQDLFDKRQLEESELENELFFSNNSDDESDDKSDDKSGDKSGDKSDNKSGDKFNSDNIEDSDSDNIRDTVDFCVYEKETYNNYQDEDGCPDTPSTDLFKNNLMNDFDSDGIIDSVDSCLTLP